jgi:hypothetical protein
MMRRYALFAGKKGHLVGHPGQAEGPARYFCQRQKPLPDGGLKGFGQPGYDGPEPGELYEPTVEIHEVTAINRKQFERAVAAGELDRSEILAFPSRDAAEKARAQLVASLIERKQKAAAKAKAAAERAGAIAAAGATDSGRDPAQEAERDLVAKLAAIETGDDVPSTERPPRLAADTTEAVQ